MVGSFLFRGNARDQCLEAAGTSRATLRNVSKGLTAGNMHQNRHKGEKHFHLLVGRTVSSVEFTVFLFFVSKCLSEILETKTVSKRLSGTINESELTDSGRKVSYLGMSYFEVFQL